MNTIVKTLEMFGDAPPCITALLQRQDDDNQVDVLTRACERASLKKKTAVERRRARMRRKHDRAVARRKSRRKGRAKALATARDRAVSDASGEEADVSGDESPAGDSHPRLGQVVHDRLLPGAAEVVGQDTEDRDADAEHTQE